jgi:hypothetical protein
MDPSGVEFGKTIGQLVTEYRTTFAWVALVWHLSTFALLYLIFRYGNRYRRGLRGLLRPQLRLASRLRRGVDERPAIREDGYGRPRGVRGHARFPPDHPLPMVQGVKELEAGS